MSARPLEYPPLILLGQCFQENLKAFPVGRRHDQIDAGSILWADCAVEVDEFANKLGGHLRPDALAPEALHRAKLVMVLVGSTDHLGISSGKRRMKPAFCWEEHSHKQLARDAALPKAGLTIAVPTSCTADMVVPGEVER
jgi:hypothetical protein